MSLAPPLEQAAPANTWGRSDQLGHVRASWAQEVPFLCKWDRTVTKPEVWGLGTGW